MPISSSSKLSSQRISNNSTPRSIHVLPSKSRETVDIAPSSSGSNSNTVKSVSNRQAPSLSLPNLVEEKTNHASSSSSSRPGLFSIVASTFTPRSMMNMNHNSSSSSSGAASKSMPTMTMKGGGVVDTSSTNATVGATGASNNSNTAATSTTAKGALVCDKCDGKHATDNCPYFKKPREAHPDATSRGKGLGSIPSTLPGATLRNARVIHQPGDGSCLFHSLSYGLKDTNASTLRNEICNYIINNPNMLIADSPISDWVKWDSGSTVAEYGRKMSRGAWGGGIEMAVVCKMRNVNVHVYEKQWDGSLKRISAFDTAVSPENRPVIRVLYCGGVHYGKYLMAIWNDTGIDIDYCVYL